MPIRIALEEALKIADISGRELARRVGCHNDTISKYRHNTVRIINLDLVEAFCSALGCQLGDVLTDQPATAIQRPVVPLPTTTTAPQPSKRPAPAVQRTAQALAAPERAPKVAAWMRRPTLTEFQALIARKKAGALRPGDAQRLANIMTYWPCWEMTEVEYAAWNAVRKGR